MTDIMHVWNSDLSFGADGSLQLASGSEEGRERVLRRLLTTMGQYTWEKTYGAGLPSLIGRTPTKAMVQATCLSQMLLEQAVSPDPPPIVTVAELLGTLQGFSVDISYVDALTGDPIFLGFDVGGGS